MSSNLDHQAVEYFKEYLRIPSVHPGCNYSSCIEFLKNQASSLELPIKVHEVAPSKPIVVISWSGSRPELPSLLLSSHMDVVPVYPEKWTYSPFGAEEDKEGNIYARGAQDMKCVGIQYMEAVRRLIKQGYKPKRSVHICFTPDEEIGSLGMQRFVETDAFRKLNVGCGLDEGCPSSDETYYLFYGERTVFRPVIVCSGTPGHGSLLLENTAGEKLSIVIKRFMEKRAEEKMKLEKNPDLIISDVTSINLTVLSGGVQDNVVPPELTVTFDCRLCLDDDVEDYKKWIGEVCKEAGDGVVVKYENSYPKIKPTKLGPENPWWCKLKTAFDEMGITVKPYIFPASTDSRFLKALGIPAFCFSPINYTETKVHAHDEFLNKKIFCDGIKVYTKLISALSEM